MPTNNEVGRRIRRAREERRLSQTELGQLLSPKRSYAAVSDIERGRTKLDVEDLSMLAVILGKPLPYFYGEEPTASVVYRRGERGLAPEVQRETDQAVELFKQFARQQLRKQPEREGQ